MDLLVYNKSIGKEQPIWKTKMPLITTPLPSFFSVFVNGCHCLTIPDEETSFDTIQNLERNGFELVWDSAPTAFIGSKYAYDTYGTHYVTHQSIAD